MHAFARLALTATPFPRLGWPTFKALVPPPPSKQCINRWLSVRLELLGISVVFGTAVLVGVAAPRSAGLAGLALTSALNLTGLMNWMVRQTTELEVRGCFGGGRRRESGWVHWCNVFRACSRRRRSTARRLSFHQ